MGTDKRLRDLVASDAAQLQTLLTSICLLVDDASFTTGDAKKVLLDVLLSSAVVADGSGINYLALTPKGFADSVATTARKGIVELSDSTNVSAESGDTVLTAGIVPELGVVINKTIAVIRTDNKLSYIDYTIITECYIYINQIGKTININGYFDYANDIVMDNILFSLLPTIPQCVGVPFGFSMSYFDGAYYRPLGGFASAVGPNTVIQGSPATGTLPATGRIYLNGSYITA